MYRGADYNTEDMRWWLCWVRNESRMDGDEIAAAAGCFQERVSHTTVIVLEFKAN